MDTRPDRAASRKWTAEEDAILTDIVNTYGAKNWKAISTMFCERSNTLREGVQCLQRWRKVLQSGLKKGKWSHDEDSTLVRLVQDQTERGVHPIRWPKIAQSIPGRTSKQCRERWTCNLDPAIVREAFTAQEDELILGFQQRFGNRWALIAQNMSGRTENAIKARCGILLRVRNSGSSAAASAGAAALSPGNTTGEDSAAGAASMPSPAPEALPPFTLPPPQLQHYLPLPTPPPPPPPPPQLPSDQEEEQEEDSQGKVYLTEEEEAEASLQPTSQQQHALVDLSTAAVVAAAEAAASAAVAPPSTHPALVPQSPPSHNQFLTATMMQQLPPPPTAPPPQHHHESSLDSFGFLPAASSPLSLPLHLQLPPSLSVTAFHHDSAASAMLDTKSNVLHLPTPVAELDRFFAEKLV